MSKTLHRNSNKYRNEFASSRERKAYRSAHKTLRSINRMKPREIDDDSLYELDLSTRNSRSMLLNYDD